MKKYEDMELGEYESILEQAAKAAEDPKNNTIQLPAKLKRLEFDWEKNIFKLNDQDLRRCTNINIDIEFGKATVTLVIDGEIKVQFYNETDGRRKQPPVRVKKIWK